MELFRTERKGGHVELGLTTMGRAVAALERFVFWFPIAAGALGLFFLPDYLGFYRAQQPAPGVFWAIVGGMAIFAALVGAAGRFARRDLWVIDADRGSVVFQTRPLIGDVRQAEADLNDLDAVVVRAPEGPAKASVGFRFDGMPDETLWESRFGAGSVDAVAGEIEGFLADRGLDVVLDRA